MGNIVNVVVPVLLNRYLFHLRLFSIDHQRSTTLKLQLVSFANIKPPRITVETVKRPCIAPNTFRLHLDTGNYEALRAVKNTTTHLFCPAQSLASPVYELGCCK